jgi:hypothetical protein
MRVAPIWLLDLFLAGLLTGVLLSLIVQAVCH